METRTCIHCGKEGTIRGLWYLTDAEEARFSCGSCYRTRNGEAAEAPADGIVAAE